MPTRMFESTRSFLNEGKPTWSSEKHIKKAYYQFAKKTHPDKFSDPTRKQAATEAFRELHCAYEDQLRRYQLGEPTCCYDDSYGDYGDQDSSETEKEEGPRKSDSEIKRTFEKVANDLKRERMEGVKTANRRGVKVVLDMWVSQQKEQCWKAAQQSLLPSGIRELSDELRESDPELSEFLRKKEAEASSARSVRWAHEESTRVARINREWSSSLPAVLSSLERWARQEWMCSDYEDIAKRVENPEAAQAIRLWKIRRVEQTDRKRSKLKREIADGIVACNAEVTQSRRLLSSLLLSEYEDIYKMLPAEVLERLTADQAGAAPRNDMEEVKQSSSGRSTRTNIFTAWIFGLMD